MKHLFTLLIFSFLGITGLHAQQKASASGFQVTSLHEDFMSGNKGLRIEFAVMFSQFVESYFARGFELDFVLVTESGAVAYDSKGKSQTTVRLEKSTDPKFAGFGMVDGDVEVFVAGKDIQLPTGTHTVYLVLAAKNEYAGFPDFHKEKISFKHEFVEAKTFDQQEFTASKPTISYNTKGFGIEEPGMDFQFKVGMKYGVDQVDTESYLLNLKILSPDGSKVLYQSKDDPSIHHKTKSLRTEDFPGEPKSFTFFVNYVVLKMDGPGDAVVVLDLEQPGIGTRELHRKVHTLNTPQKYRFDEQAFTPGRFDISRGMKDGVTGLSINFHCNFKYSTPLIDHERGDYYFFVLIQTESGDTAFSPTFLRRMDYATTTAWDPHNPLLEPSGADVKLFIPMHRMRLKQGPQALKYTVFVSDKARRARFAPIGTGKIQVDQPRVLSYQLAVKHLEVISGNYDAQVAVFGNILPDLEWHIEVGNDTEYQSPVIENSLVASIGTAKINLSEGDVVNLGLWDIDSGFFNRNDVLGTWVIPYAGKGDQFSHRIDSQGVIDAFEVEITKK